MKLKIVCATLLMVISTAVSASDICRKYDCEEFANRLISYDARSWFFNRYDYNSAEVVRSWSSSSYKDKVLVDYTYNNGRSGWAELVFHEGEFHCVRYHDFANECRTSRKF